MLRRTALFLSFLLFSLQGMAIDALVTNTVFYQHGTAPNNSLTPTLELVWQINPRTIKYSTNAEKNIVARIKADILITNESGTVRQEAFILNTPPRKDIAGLATLKLIDLRRYPVPPGLTKIRLQFTDVADTTNKFIYTDSLMVAEPSASPFYSGILLADTAIETAEQSPFLKNGKHYIPLPTNFLDEPKTMLHYYAELYNSDKTIAGNQPLIQKVFVSKSEKGFAINRVLKTDTLPAQSAPFIVSGSLPITTIGSGNYFVNITLEDYSKNTIATRSLFFQRLNAHPAKDTVKKIDITADTSYENVTVLDLSKTFLSKYSTTQVKAILKMLLPIADPLATQSINGFLKTPDDMYMRYFVFNFFSAINKKDPGRAWREYSDKVLKVNKLFTSQGVPGYETQRGYMYLRYGPPTDITTMQNETGTLPYEIWQYNVLTQMNKKEIANAFFLFYRRSNSFSDFELLHSNVTGEVVNTSWRRYLYINAQGGSSGNSRAEQYIGNR
jgi:GWxTD domain-containing protein